MSSPNPFRQRAYALIGVLVDDEASVDAAVGGESTDAEQAARLAMLIASARFHRAAFDHALTAVALCGALDVEARQRALSDAAHHGARWQDAIARLKVAVGHTSGGSVDHG